MVRGMTGFGSVEFTSNNLKAIIEIKSINHRYFDTNFILPSGFGSLENKIRQVLQKQIERGRVTVAVKIAQKTDQTISLDKNAVRTHLKNINQLKKEFKLKNDLTLSDIIKLPGVFVTKDQMVNTNTLWPILEKNIKKALTGLLVMRAREGRSLSMDVSDKLKRMLLQINKIQKRAKIILKDKKKNLTDEEFQSFQKGNDINEEVSRFKHYLDEIKMLLKSNVAVGKKIDFIAQEMQRETNTIGAKLQDKVVSNAVIALKSKIEKIREQAQNIE